MIMPYTFDISYCEWPSLAQLLNSDGPLASRSKEAWKISIKWLALQDTAAQ